MVRRAIDNYYQQNPRISKQSLQGAVKSISRELKNNSSPQLSVVSSHTHAPLTVLNNNDNYVCIY